jgi:hypothetical protein
MRLCCLREKGTKFPLGANSQMFESKLQGIKFVQIEWFVYHWKALKVLYFKWCWIFNLEVQAKSYDKKKSRGWNSSQGTSS